MSVVLVAVVANAVAVVLSAYYRQLLLLLLLLFFLSLTPPRLPSHYQCHCDNKMIQDMNTSKGVLFAECSDDIATMSDL